MANLRPPHPTPLVQTSSLCCFVLSEGQLKGLVVWVTGASSGLGEELAYQLATCGCRLILSARREDELNRVKRNCLGKNAIIFAFIPIFLIWSLTNSE